MTHLKKKKKGRKERKASPVLEKKPKLHLLTDGESSSVGLNDNTLLPQMLLEKKNTFIIELYLSYLNHLLGLFIIKRIT